MTAMNHGAINKALVDWIEFSTGMPRENIRFRDQKALEPQEAYCELFIDALYSISDLDEVIITDNEDDPPTVNIARRGPRRMLVFVEFHTMNAGRDADAFALCALAQSSLQTDTVREYLAVGGVVLNETGRIYKRSTMKGAQWERIAKLDVQFRVTSEVSEDLETIEHVVISAPDLDVPETIIDL